MISYETILRQDFVLICY